jgi:uncharacterized membrane protein YqhA
MKRWLVRLTKGLNPIVLPAMTVVAPTMPLVFQLGFGVVILITAHSAVEEWRRPDPVRMDRIVAALTVIGLLLSGLLLILMMASALHRFVQQPSAPSISQS